MPIVFSFFAEVLSREKRGEHLSWLCMFWMIGEIYASAMAWAIIPHYGELSTVYTYLDLLFLGLCLGKKRKVYLLKALKKIQLATLMRSLAMLLEVKSPTTGYKTVASPWPWVEMLAFPAMKINHLIGLSA